MPDGSRKRRQGNSIKARWYAWHRSVRFMLRFGLCNVAPKPFTG